MKETNSTLENKTPEMLRIESPVAWEKYFFEDKGYETKLVMDIDGKNYSASDWIKGKEIRVFLMPNVNAQVVGHAIAGIQDMINDIELDFSVKYYGSLESAVNQVKQAINYSGRIEGETLQKIVLSEDFRKPELGGSQHADVFITDRYLALGDENWGQSEFSGGYMILALNGGRQNSLDFIRNIAKHETGHLLGYAEHHSGFGTNVKGYSSVSDCNMDWQASTRVTCDKCKAAITAFWRGIEYRTRERYFKN